MASSFSCSKTKTDYLCKTQITHTCEFCKSNIVCKGPFTKNEFCTCFHQIVGTKKPNGLNETKIWLAFYCDEDCFNREWNGD